VWPKATSTSLLPTHPKRTLALGYLGYRKRLALSVFSLSCPPNLGTAQKKLLGVRFRMGGAFSNFNNFLLIQISKKLKKNTAEISVSSSIDSTFF
jgi:hypothetical protein